MHLCFRYMCLILGASALFALTTAADEAARWSLPRFASDAATLNQSAASVNLKAGTDVVVLDEENSYIFDETG